MENVMKSVWKKIGEVAYKQAEREVNKACPYFHNQPKIPQKVDELRKLKKYDE